jgi:hypothetical protein
MAAERSRITGFERRRVGLAALHRELDLAVPAPTVTCYVGPTSRRTEISPGEVIETYPRQYDPGTTLLDQLKFALRHEPLDLAVLAAACAEMGDGPIETWVRSEPTGGQARRAWFLYETLTGRALDLEPVRTGNYVDALDRKRQYTAAPHQSRRHRVNDNLLGSALLCPTVRRTQRLDTFSAAGLETAARAFAQRYDEPTLARAVTYLYTKETRSTFAIEGERPARNREERFIAALRAAIDFDPTAKDSFVRLHALIVEPRYAETGWRTTQNFIGETYANYREQVHFVPPQPADLPPLMDGWMVMVARLLESDLDPVVAGAIAAFAFVYLHPFEDGNGRMHRYLIHTILTKKRFTPPNMIFPVSAAIRRDRRAYDEVLETFSKRIMPHVDWQLAADGPVTVRNETRHLYRSFDATPHAEYLYERVRETIERDLPEELAFVARYDAALRAVIEVVDMPDQRASLLARLIMQNDGRFPRRRRQEFAELADDEIAAMEVGIERATEQMPAPAA